MQDIAITVRDFVTENLFFGEGDGHFSDDDSFFEKGLVDSVGILTLVEFVRENFAITIEEEELLPENWDSVHRIATFVENKLGSNI